MGPFSQASAGGGEDVSHFAGGYMTKEWEDGGISRTTSQTNKLYELSRKKGGESGISVSDYAEIFTANEPIIYSETIAFSAFIGVSVCTNLILLAAETDLSCHGNNCSDTENAVWGQLDIAFTVSFIFDISVAIYSVGIMDYFRGDPLFWTAGFDGFHCFDFTLVLCRVFDLLLRFAGVDSGLKFFSAFRMVHLGRFVKRISSPTFRELWLILAEMGGTAKAVGWVAGMLLLIMWVFAILITIVVGKGVEAREFNFRSSNWTKDDYWGTVPKSLYSLFQVITRDKWSDGLVGPLIERYNWLVLIFIPFMCITVLALMNTIVGVVVESTLASAKANEEKEGKEKRELDGKVLATLEKIFKDADTNGSGHLTREELSGALRKPVVRQRLKMLDIPLGDLDLLFTLLDENDTGEIKTDMFFRGCSKLRGPAMSVDLHHLSVDLDHHIKWSAEHVDRTTECCDLMMNLLDLVDNVDVDILRDEADEKDPVLMARRTRATNQSKGTFLRNNRTVGLETEDPADRRQASKSLVKASLRAASKQEPESKKPSKTSVGDESAQRALVRGKSTRSISKKQFQWPS